MSDENFKHSTAINTKPTESICQMEIQDTSGIYAGSYYPCGRAAKYKIRNKNVRGGEDEIIVCGIHRNSHMAWLGRIKKRLEKDWFISEEII